MNAPMDKNTNPRLSQASISSPMQLRRAPRPSAAPAGGDSAVASGDRAAPGRAAR